MTEPTQRIDTSTEPHHTASDAVVMALPEAIEEPVGGDVGHVRRVRQGSQILAQQLRQQGEYRHEISDEFLRQLFWASPLHDVGKIAVDRRILAKPDRLTPAEFEEIRQHVTAGAPIRSGRRAFGRVAAVDDGRRRCPVSS